MFNIHSLDSFGVDIQMKVKILNALRKTPMTWKQIKKKFGEKSFDIMKELIEKDKIKSAGQQKWEIK